MKFEKTKTKIKFTNEEEKLINDFYDKIIDPFCVKYLYKEENKEDTKLCTECPFAKICNVPLTWGENDSDALKELLEAKINNTK